MIADGLDRAGLTEPAARIVASSLDLIRQSGFAEYYDPQTGEPLGARALPGPPRWCSSFSTGRPEPSRAQRPLSFVRSAVGKS